MRYTLQNNYSTVHSGLTYSLQTRFASTRIISTATTGRDWGFAIHSRLSLEQWQWGVRKPVPFVEVILLSYVFMIVQYCMEVSISCWILCFMSFVDHQDCRHLKHGFEFYKNLVTWWRRRGRRGQSDGCERCMKQARTTTHAARILELYSPYLLHSVFL